MFRINVFFFQDFSSILQPFFRQHRAANGRPGNGQPIGKTVHSYCVENFKDSMQRYVGEGLVAVVDWEKYNFSRTPCIIIMRYHNTTSNS